MKKQWISLITASALVFAGSGCRQNPPASSIRLSESSDKQNEDRQNNTDLQDEEQTSPDRERKETMQIRITAGSHVIHASLADNHSARVFYDSLPVTLPMRNLYGREVCYRMGSGSLPSEEAEDTGYEIGDLSYWPPMGSLVILYEQNGEIFEQQPIGHTDDDISFFKGMDDTDITFEKSM